MTTDIQNPNLKLIWSTRRLFVGLLGLVLVSIALIFFLLVPEIQTSWSRWHELQEVKAQEAKLSEKLDQLIALETSPDLQQQTIVNSALPSRKPFFELLQSMNLVSQQSNVVIDSFEITPGIVASDSAGQAASVEDGSSGGESALEVKYSVEGKFNELNDYLRNIESITPFTTVVKLNIDSEISHVNLSETFKAEVMSETYYFTQALTTSESLALPKMSAASDEAIQALKSYNAVVIPKQLEIIGGQQDIFGKTLDIMGKGATSAQP